MSGITPRPDQSRASSAISQENVEWYKKIVLPEHDKLEAVISKIKKLVDPSMVKYDWNNFGNWHIDYKFKDGKLSPILLAKNKSGEEVEISSKETNDLVEEMSSIIKRIEKFSRSYFGEDVIDASKKDKSQVKENSEKFYIFDPDDLIMSLIQTSKDTTDLLSNINVDEKAREILHISGTLIASLASPMKLEGLLSQRKEAKKIDDVKTIKEIDDKIINTFLIIGFVLFVAVSIFLLPNIAALAAIPNIKVVVDIISTALYFIYSFRDIKEKGEKINKQGKFIDEINRFFDGDKVNVDALMRFLSENIFLNKDDEDFIARKLQEESKTTPLSQDKIKKEYENQLKRKLVEFKREVGAKNAKEIINLIMKMKNNELVKPDDLKKAFVELKQNLEKELKKEKCFKVIETICTILVLLSMISVPIIEIIPIIAFVIFDLISIYDLYNQLEGKNINEKFDSFKLKISALLSHCIKSFQTMYNSNKIAANVVIAALIVLAMINILFLFYATMGLFIARKTYNCIKISTQKDEKKSIPQAVKKPEGFKEGIKITHEEKNPWVDGSPSLA